MSASLLLAAVGGGIEQDIVTRLGGAAGLVAILGIVLVLPLYVTQRREVKRLQRWRELEPERGDETVPGHPDYGAYTAAVATGTVPRPGSYPTTSTRLSPAERVTADRPALSRITAERQAIQSPSFWRRFFARGPRHPVVLALIGILLAGAVVVGVGFLTGTLGESDGGKGSGGGSGTPDGLDKAAIEVVVLNATATPAVGDQVADDLDADGFTSVTTAVNDKESNQTIVLFAEGFEKAANKVANKLGVEVLQPIDREAQAASDGADVVVIAGEDRARD